MTHKLNAQQKQVHAMTMSSPELHMAITAGPGTGKTTSLVLRVKGLIQAQVSPSEIACVTFTRASARDLKQRITSPVAVQTFHSLLLHILKLQAYPPAHTFVSDTIWQDYLTNVVLKTHTQHRPPIQTHEPHLWNLVLEVITRHHAWILSPPKDPLIRWISSVLIEYYLRRPCPVISLTDLEVFFYLHLTTHRLHYFPYTHVLIDEFQDTSRIQFDIYTHYVKHTPLTLCIVGDAKQSIYGFRKAHVQNFTDMKQFLHERGGHSITLHTNYRSSKQILTLANTFQDHFLKSNDPHLVSDCTSTSSVSHHSLDDEDTVQADIIEQCELAAHQSSQTAVLFRTTRRIKEIYSRLSPSAATHTSLSETTSLHRWPFARSLMYGYLSSLFPTVTLYYQAWLTSPWRPIKKLPEFSFHAPTLLTQLQRSAQVKPHHIDDILCVQQAIRLIQEASLLFLPSLPYQLEAYLLKLIDPLEPFHFSHPNPPKRQTSPLSLYTLHSAKGLEFDNVILPLFKDTFPRIQAYPKILEHQNYWSIRYRQTASTWVEGEVYSSLKSKYKQHHLEEELRLLYVAITRAKKRLTIYTIPNETPDQLVEWLTNQPETISPQKLSLDNF